MASSVGAPPVHARRLSHVARASLLIAALFAIDKPLDLLRQILIGRQFGVGVELDAFNAANNLPDLLRALITGGALSLALIPVLSETLERTGRPALWTFFSRVANLAFGVTAGLAVIVAVFAEPIVTARIRQQARWPGRVARLARSYPITTGAYGGARPGSVAIITAGMSARWTDIEPQ